MSEKQTDAAAHIEELEDNVDILNDKCHELANLLQDTTTDLETVVNWLKEHDVPEIPMQVEWPNGAQISVLQFLQVTLDSLVDAGGWLRSEPEGEGNE